MRVPSDYAVLTVIYDRYYTIFASFTKDNPDRAAKIFVPIDIQAIAKYMNVDPDIIFGRLYYHMEEKYGYKRTDGSRVPFFSLAIGPDKHCINFPLLGSVLAGMQEQRCKDLWAIWLSGISLVVSIISMIVSLRFT